MEWQLNENSKSIVSTGPIEQIQEDHFINWTLNNRQGVQLFDRSPESIGRRLAFNVDKNEFTLKLE